MINHDRFTVTSAHKFYTQNGAPQAAAEQHDCMAPQDYVVCKRTGVLTVCSNLPTLGKLQEIGGFNITA